MVAFLLSRWMRPWKRRRNCKEYMYMYMYIYMYIHILRHIQVDMEVKMLYVKTKLATKLLFMCDEMRSVLFMYAYLVPICQRSTGVNSWVSQEVCKLILQITCMYVYINNNYILNYYY